MTVRNMRSVMRERVWYTSPSGVEFILDDRPNRALLFMNGWGSSRADRETTRSPYQSGDRNTAFHYSPRTITMLFRYTGYSRDRLWQNRKAFLNAIRLTDMDLENPTEGTLSRLLSTGEVFTIGGLFTTGPVFGSNTESWDAFSYTEQLTFTASNPIIYNPIPLTETLSDFDINNTQTTTISYAGTYKSFPVIVITGPGDSFVISNITTGTEIRYDAAVAVGETITIDLSENEKTVISSISGLSAYSNIDKTDDFSLLVIQPASILAADGDNEIEVEIVNGTAASGASLTYYEKYEGI